MFFIITISLVLFLISVLLIIVVLFQNPRSEGGMMMGGDYAMKHVIGSANIPHILEKVTRFLVIVFFLLTLLLSNLVFQLAK